MCNRISLNSSCKVRKSFRKFIKKFLSGPPPYFCEMFRWDAMEKEIEALVGKKTRVMNRKVGHKSPVK
jgi:hypothetical protein